ncbi:MAG TPA: hypothetical protein VM221_08360 [Armatimonadota bacterium]|nr:hypothetical protein [Armatimonadota bacterium]
MEIRGARAAVVAGSLVVLAAASLLAGCNRDYSTYRGGPVAFSTHSYRIEYPAGFARWELPQTDRDIVPVSFFYENIRFDPKDPKQRSPGMIFVRCHRMRAGESVQAFVNGMYDELTPQFLDVKLRKVPKGSSGRPEYVLSVENESYQVARVIPLPREKLAYEVETVCAPAQRKAFEELFGRARESFQILPLRK